MRLNRKSVDTPRPSYGHGGKTAGGRNEKAHFRPVKFILKITGMLKPGRPRIDWSRHHRYHLTGWKDRGFPVSNPAKPV